MKKHNLPVGRQSVGEMIARLSKNADAEKENDSSCVLASTCSPGTITRPSNSPNACTSSTPPSQSPLNSLICEEILSTSEEILSSPMESEKSVPPIGRV